MQVNSGSGYQDPAITSAQIQNQIDLAVALKARQVEKQQGEAAIELIQDAASIGQQLSSGHIDVKL